MTARGQAPAGATAVVERTGDKGILRVSGLPQRTNGIYEVWIARDGEVVPVDALPGAPRRQRRGRDPARGSRTPIR